MRKKVRVCPICGKDLKKEDRLKAFVCVDCNYRNEARDTKKFENFSNSEIR